MKLTKTEIAELSEARAMDPALLEMVCNVEAPNGGHLPDGRPVILFEGHKFYEYLPGSVRKAVAAKYPTLCHAKWSRQHYMGGAAEHDKRLAVAAEIDREAALMACSWGRPQILGKNYQAAGFGTLQAFINAMYKPEKFHINAMITFIRSWPKQAAALNAIPAYTGKTDAEKVADLIERCNAFAACYNGPGHAANQYGPKMAKEYLRLTGQPALAKLIKLK